MINIRFNHILWFIVCWFAANSSTAEPIAESKLKQLLTPIDALSANFSQRILNKQDEVIDEVTGNFQAMEPNRFNWVIEKPMPQQIISNGTKLWIYDPDLAQVIIQPFDDRAQPNPISLLLDSPDKLDQHFDISYIHNGKSTADTFLLKPKQSNTLFTQLQLEFFEKKPVGLRYTNNYSQIVQIIFDDLVINPTTSTADFNFDIPTDIDVVNHVR